MGEKKKQQQNRTNESGGESGKELPPSTLEDFMTKENSDQSYTIRGCDDSPKCYADWPQIRSLLTSNLLFSRPESTGEPPSEEVVSILVPGCGSSRLSEHLYDAGFTNITNVDLSKVVISHMLRRNVRERPLMKWRVMDMTTMQFPNETFDAIVDKGGLDGLMEPKLGLISGNIYLSEVKRLLKAGGKYICVTFAERNVLDLMFPKFRFGWKVNLHAIAHEQSSGDLGHQAFMVVAEKLVSIVVSQISLSLDGYSVESHGYQAEELYEALEREKRIRTRYSNASDIFCPFEDLILGAKANLTELEPGRSVKFILGEPGVSRFFYDCLLFDAQRDSGPFSHQFLVYINPNMIRLEWILSLSEVQWLIVRASNAARLLTVVLSSRHSNVHMKDIWKDLSPLVKQLTPKDYDDRAEIPYVVVGDGITKREIVHQVKSILTGIIVVDDVMYEETYPANKGGLIRRLTILNMVKDKALLSRGPIGSSEIDKKKVQATSRTKKKGKQKKQHSYSSGSHEASGAVTVHHNYLTSSHHNAFISGLMLISVYFKGSTSAEGLVKTVVIGLRAGLLPMFMNNCLPYLKIEVVELDPVLLDVAREYFDFREDGHVKAHVVTNGVKFVREKANSDTDGKVDILIVDVETPQSCPGSEFELLSPAAEFVEESFLLDVRNSLSEQGVFIINLVSSSSDVRSRVHSRLKMVFGNLLYLELEEDLSEVIFGLKTEIPIEEDQLAEACNALAASLQSTLKEPIQRKRIIGASKFIKPLR